MYRLLLQWFFAATNLVVLLNKHYIDTKDFLMGVIERTEDSFVKFS